MVRSADPAAGTGEVLAAGVAHAGPADAEAAIVAAHEAFQTWRLTPPFERARLLRKAADIMREHAEELALLDTYNTGNPIREMLSDANIAAASCDYFAGIIPMLRGDTVPCGESALQADFAALTLEASLNYTVREPIGVVARIIAYNHPVMFAGAKIGPPLAAGCTVSVRCAASTDDRRWCSSRPNKRRSRVFASPSCSPTCSLPACSTSCPVAAKPAKSLAGIRWSARSPSSDRCRPVSQSRRRRQRRSSRRALVATRRS